MRPSVTPHAALAAVFAFSIAASAAAEEAAPPDLLVDPALRRSWNEGPRRYFLATTVDVGYLYLRPRASLGYGRPHALWAGVEANPIVQGSGLGAYGGVRGVVPFLDMRVGARGFYAFEHSYLAPAGSYDRLDLETTNGGHASYVVYESELTASASLGPGEVSAVGSLSSIHGVPAGVYLFEETLRVIVKPPLLWRARGAYALFALPGLGRHSIGPVVDVLGVPGRDALIVRAGLVTRVLLSRNLEVRGTFVPTVAGPDRIGLAGGDFTELGLRWRWATE
jgi:hypothetical protein